MSLSLIWLPLCRAFSARPTADLLASFSSMHSSPRCRGVTSTSLTVSGSARGDLLDVDLDRVPVFSNYEKFTRCEHKCTHQEKAPKFEIAGQTMHHICSGQLSKILYKICLPFKVKEITPTEKNQWFRVSNVTAKVKTSDKIKCCTGVGIGHFWQLWYAFKWRYAKTYAIFSKKSANLSSWACHITIYPGRRFSWVFAWSESFPRQWRRLSIIWLSVCTLYSSHWLIYTCDRVVPTRQTWCVYKVIQTMTLSVFSLSPSVKPHCRCWVTHPCS